MTERSILIVEDETHVATAIAELCRRLGYGATTAASAARGARELRQAKPSLVVLDIGLPDRSGLELLGAIREIDAELPVLIVTAHGNLQNAVEAKKQGATGYLVKPLDLTELANTMRSLLDARPVEAPVDPSVATDAPGRHSGEQPPLLIGSAPAMQPAFAAIAHACASDVPVLISGPTGIGKSLTAGIIHRHGSRHAAPFVSVACGSLAAGPLEVELFGDAESTGLVERAVGGTLLLDEVDELPLELQVKVLRCVEEKVFVRAGGGEERPADVRIVAATNVDLQRAVADGRFREDLLYRLRVLEVPMPALAARRSDLRALASYLLSRAAQGRDLKISERAMQQLEAWDWPGNVRELRNVLERAVAVCGGPMILPEHLPESLLRDTPAESVADRRLSEALHEWLEQRLVGEVDYATLHGDLEGQVLRLLLDRHGGKPTLLARAMDMNRATLRRKLRSLRVDLDDEGQD